ncbi:MAG TPA: hypothetical protein VKV95_18660 [Terriglobia bacterium]|nr:hypothetical protein [Terriglobia bacterium]
MRIASLTLATLLLSGISLRGQEGKPLGDVARGQKSNPSKPAKVFTNDDVSTSDSADSGGLGEPVSATDDPLVVVNNARDALLRDRAHVCRREAAGNSGPRPGWTDKRLMEVAGPDRFHIVSDQTNQNVGHSEWIIIGKDGYRRTGTAGWEKIPPAEMAMAGMIQNALVPEELKFGFKKGDLKLIRQEAVNGTPAFLYQYSAHVGDMDRTTSFWVGIKDNLPLKVAMNTVTRSTVTAPITWTETTSCSFGQPVTIEPPF